MQSLPDNDFVPGHRCIDNKIAILSRDPVHNLLAPVTVWDPQAGDLVHKDTEREGKENCFSTLLLSSFASMEFIRNFRDAEVGFSTDNDVTPTAIFNRAQRKSRIMDANRLHILHAHSIDIDRGKNHNCGDKGDGSCSIM